MGEAVEMRESPRGKSMLSGFAICQRYWSWEYVRGFKPLVVADHFINGSIVHEAQEVFYNQPYSDPQEGYDRTIKRAKGMLAELDDATQARMEPKVLQFLEVWYQQIGQFEHERYTVVAVEEEREILLENGFRMTVRWDRALYDQETKEIFISDTKTTGWSLDGTIENYMRADQPKLYILSAQNELWHDQLSGWRTDVLYVNRSVRRAVRSEIVMPTQEEMLDVKRSFTSMTDDIAFKLAQVESGVPIGDTFYRNEANCRNKYGKLCPHFEHCHKIDDMSYVPEGYKVDPWLLEGVIKDAFKEIKV